MGQKKKRKAGLSWQVRREKRTGLIMVLAVIGVAAAVCCYLLQSSGLLSMNTDQEAVEKNTVMLNEIVSQNVSSVITETGEVPDWVEIRNTGREAVEIGHYGLMLESGINDMYTFPAYSLQPDETVLVYCAGGGARGDWSAAFKLEASGGDRLILLNGSGKAIDGVELPELSEDEAYIRNEDGSWRAGNPTPGAANDAKGANADRREIEVEAGEIELSEVSSANTLYFKDENGEGHDYVELQNKGTASVNLAGWYLSDSSDKLKRWAFPEVSIPAGGSLAVHCSGLNRTENVNHLHTDFKLGSDGENVYLSRPDGKTVSVIETPELQANQAYSLAEGKWTTELAPTPGYANTAENAARVNAQTFGDKSAGLCLNEIMTSPTQQNSDWVEIYNGSGAAIDLSGYGLSDNSEKPRKWQFPAGTTIRAGEYLGVFLSGTEAATLNGFLNADFALSSAGGYTVSLSDPEGKILDAAYLPQQYGGVAYGRVSGREGYYLLESGTPGTSNEVKYYQSRAAEADASVQGGLYRKGERFSVELKAEAGSRIYYTLDCSDPDESATLYTGPIEISKTTILRSRVYRENSMPSYTDTQSYLYDVNNDNGSVYVISLVSDPSNLEGGRGIITNHSQDWEREAHVELMAADGSAVISQGCGISLHGMDSRKLPIKSFNVIARSRYGERRFNYPIFSERDYQEYQSILLRASGEDYNMSFMRDTMLSSLMKDSSVLYQKYEIGVCYLNGAYYTLCYIRERINEHSICQFEGWEGMENEIDLVKANSSVNQGSNDSFEALLSWVKKNDTTTDEALEYISSRIDVQNFIEYMALQIFSGNTDTLNVRRYRNPLGDGQWHWALFDLDWAFFNDVDSITSWLTPGGTGAGKRTDNTLFIACMKNPAFRDRFLTHLGEQMATVFTSENVVARIYERYERLENLLPDYMDKWNLNLVNGPKKLVAYAKERPVKLLGYIKKCFNFNDAQMEHYFGAAIQKAKDYASGKAGE